MKRTLLSLTAALLAVFSFCSCEKSHENDPNTDKVYKTVPVYLTKTQNELVTSGNVFAFDFFRAMVARSEGEGVLVSPFSLQAALSMLANGAEAETYKEIVKALGWEGYSIEDVNSLYSRLTGGLREADDQVTLEIANSAWTQKDFPILDSYISGLKENYDAEAKSVDFTSPSTLSQINKWCSDKTHGLIPQMLDNLNPYTRLMLINALYFKGTWQKEFDKKKSGNAKFTSSKGTTKMRFMNDTRDCLGLYTESFKLCEIPYGGGLFTFDVILPDERTDIDKFVEGMDDDFWASCRTKMRAYEVDFSLPAFTQDYSSEENIIPFLKERGMRRAFDDGEEAQFGKISPKHLFVGEILQKTLIKTDEKGSEAAAVTEIGVRVGSALGPDVVIEVPKMTFKADRPFFYILREQSSGTILFIGIFRG